MDKFFKNCENFRSRMGYIVKYYLWEIKCIRNIDMCFVGRNFSKKMEIVNIFKVIFVGEIRGSLLWR